MLCLSGSLLNKPVLSLRSGGPVARVISPIFNPRNLKIEGFYCDDHRSKQASVLLYQDIRELSTRGFIVNDHDVLAQPEDLVRLQEILKINFELLGKHVETVSKEKLGKVTDYAVETTTMYVQKLYLSQSFLKNLAGGSLSVDRSQIVEVTNRHIIIQEVLKGTTSQVAVTAA
jgi:uncharacterized protein YrrD